MILTGIEKKMGNFSLIIDSLKFSKPGIYGLIGPNGCGKSTLAKIITGLIKKDQGDIDTEGLDLRDITYLGRKPYMMDDTVYNNLIYPLKLRNIKPDDELIKSFLNKMNFYHRSDQKAKSLSGGEQQKLSFLRAVIFNPKFIIADEALSAIDIDSLELFEDIILKEKENEKSIWIIISHQMPQIKRLCDYIFFMHDGKIETKGNVNEIFTNNDEFFLKQYLRSYNGT